jgi:hypothetical protein
MLMQVWVNGIAVAVVAGILINAWLALYPRMKHSAKPKEMTPQMQWTLLRNEAEISRRLAPRSGEGTDPERERSGTGEQ